MRTCDWRSVRMVGVACVVAVVCQAAQAGYVVETYNQTGVNVAPSGMEAVFGAKVAELDAKAYGFNFLFKRDGTGVGYDDPFHGHRNLNVISEVFVADHAVTIGAGIELQPGDYTFAYTLDYSQLDYILADSAVQDFQILRTILGLNPPVSNPGPNIPIDVILGGAYNTNLAFGSGAGTPPLLAYPDGMSGEAVDFGALIADKVEYDWGGDLVNPGSKAMILMFTSPNVQVWQVGWGSLGGQGLAEMVDRDAVGATGEGGGTLGGGQSIPDSIPVLIPVIPEPVTLALLAVGSLALLKRRV